MKAVSNLRWICRKEDLPLNEDHDKENSTHDKENGTHDKVNGTQYEDEFYISGMPILFK